MIKCSHCGDCGDITIVFLGVLGVNLVGRWLHCRGSSSNQLITIVMHIVDWPVHQDPEYQMAMVSAYTISNDAVT